MPILPTMSRNNSFTLIEIIAVITVMALAAGIAVSTLRGPSPARQMESASLEFETFCAGVRYQAMEHGEERIVFLDVNNRQLLMKKPESDELQEEPDEIRTKWTFPEEFTLEIENDTGEELFELFRFFPDGGASGLRELDFRCRSLQRKYTVSPLTGRLISEEAEE